MTIGILFWGGEPHAFPTPCSHTPTSPPFWEGSVGAGSCWGKGWTSVPRGHWAQREVAKSLRTVWWGRMSLSLGPLTPPSPGCVSARFCAPYCQPGRLSSSLQVNHCPGLSLLCLLLGPQLTWPPGLCPAGNPAAGAAASIAGSCSSHNITSTLPPVQPACSFQDLPRPLCFSFSLTSHTLGLPTQHIARPQRHAPEEPVNGGVP